ncbi:MAG: hypothetical protein OXT09_33440 [Myxococcales bacterium]|nr:hypothetical protein [Myxococcales bacterium]
MAENDRRGGGLLAVTLVVAAALGLGLRADSLQTGFFSDDFVEEAMLQGHYPAERGALDLFNFVDGSKREVQLLMARGALPWWSAPDLKLAMFRPLTSALVGLDRALFGADPFARHLHSALWWVLALWAAVWLWRGLLPPAAVVVAALFFALEEAHTLPLSWLANRGALVALAGMTAALALHVRARERGARGSWAAVALPAPALLAGEWAFPFLGYFLAYELLRGAGGAGARLRALAPVAALGLGYLVLRAALGYGTRGSGVYIDAVSEPIEFLAAAVQRLPVFSADLVWGLPAHHWDFGAPAVLGFIDPLPRWRQVHWALGAGAVVLLPWALWVLRRSGAGERWAHLPWLCLGAALALVPMVSSFPTSRLVLPAVLGIAPLAAALVVEGFERLRTGAVAPLRVLAWVILMLAILRVNTIGAVASSRGDAAMTRYLAGEGEAWMLGANLGGDDPSARIVQLAASEHTVSLFTPLVRATRGRTMPKSFWTLSMADSPLRVHRPTPHQLELTAVVRPFVDTSVERLYRDSDAGFTVGQRIEIDGLTVEILELSDGRPRRARFTFEHVLEDPRYRFVTCSRDGIGPVSLPAVGGTLELGYAGFPGN